MAKSNAQSALEQLRKKYGIKGSTTPNTNENRRQSTSASSKSSTSTKNNSLTTQDNSKAALEQLRKKYNIRGTDYGSAPTDSTKKPTDYSSTVKYLQDRDIQGASGIMTEKEWQRRKGASGGTYQNYLDEQIERSKPVSLSVNVDGGTRRFGNISLGAYKAIEENALDRYVPRTEEEEKALLSYTKFAEEYAKKQREPENLGQGLLHGIGYTAEKIGAGAFDAIGDAGNYILAGGAKLLTGITPSGTARDDLKKYAASQLKAKTLGDLWDESAESRYRVPDWYRHHGGATSANFGAMVPAMVAEVATMGAAPAMDSLIAKTAYSATAGTTKSAISSVAKNLSTKLIKPKASDVMFGLGAAGSSAKAGYEKSGDVGKSLNYGLLNGLGEVATEKIFGGFAGTDIGESLIDFNVKNKYLRRTLNIATEPIEEMIMAEADPVFQRLTVNPNAKFADIKDLGESAFQAILLSTFSNAATFPVRQYQKRHSIRVLNNTAEGINAILQNDADKFEPLKNNASYEEIEERQNQIKAFNEAYEEILTNEVVNSNPEVFGNRQITTPTTLEQTAREVVERRNRSYSETAEASKSGRIDADTLDILTQHNVEITPEQAKKVTGFDSKGAELVTKLANAEGATFNRVVAEVKPSYLAGFNNPDLDIKKVAHTFNSQAQADAYTAGQMDDKMEALAAQERAKNARVFGDESGVVMNEHSKQYTADQIKMADTVGKDLGSKVSFEERLLIDTEKGYEANAWHEDGEIKRSNTSDNKFIADIMEESLHRIKEMNTEAAQVLMREAFNFAIERDRSRGVDATLLFDKEKDLHDNNEITLSTGGYIEEVSVGELSTMLFKDEKEWLRWRERLDTNSELRTAWQKLMDVVSEIIEKLKRLLAEGSFSKATREKVNKDITDLKRFKDLYTEAYKQTSDAVAERTKEMQSSELKAEVKTETNSTKSLEFEVNEDYNDNISYSLQWRTDLNKTQYKQVENWIRQAGNPESTRITDNANWYKGRIDGEDLFVIYSDKSTVLYEVKGANANLEHSILLDLLEVRENGKSINGKSGYVSWVSKGSWLQNVNGSQNNIGNLGSGQNNQNAGVLQGQSQRNGSRAFWNVLENLFREPEVKSYSLKDTNPVTYDDNGDIIPLSERFSDSEDIRFSLKGGISNKELRDTIMGAQKGKRAAIEKLAKYAEDGVIRTEAYEQLIEKHGVIPTGENPHRDTKVPRKTEKNKKVSQTVRTILEAKATPDEAVPTIEKMVEDGIFSYEAYSDKDAIANAEKYIKEYGWAESYKDWNDAVNKGEVSKDITTIGWVLYNNAANRAASETGDLRKQAVQESLNILDAMVRHQRSAAQALQATRILKKLSPETQLYAVSKSVSAFQKELSNKYGDKAPNLEINRELAEQFLTAETEERYDAEVEIYKDIGRQMPADWLDRWNAWRYLAMLGNLRTHGRNIVGNAFFAPVVLTKDLAATAIESAVYRISGKKMLRGKALVLGSKADKALLKAAWNDYSNVADLISNGGKHNDGANANKYIEGERKILNNWQPRRKLLKPLATVSNAVATPFEWARKKNSELLEREDMWFSKPHYAYALAQYCKANNISPEQISRGKAIAPAREYAIKEASKATYRDLNEFSQWVSGLGRSGRDNQNKWEKRGRIVVEGVQPFRKTPANILVRGIEYSPLGLMKSIAQIRKIGTKRKDGTTLTATEVIDNISAGLTGTGLYALGILLAAQGLIRGHGEDDEKEKEFNEMMGHQAYALELPNGQSITLDWLAPEALPFFMGVNTYEINSRKKPNEALTMSDMIIIATRIGEPMLEMSCLQGINDAIENTANAKNDGSTGIMALLSGATTSYLTQGIPTLLGQAERTGQAESMTTFVQKDAFLTKGMQRTLGKISAKIPGWDYSQIPYIDAWGRKEASGVALKRGLNNFLNPAYTSEIKDSYMEKELLRLYEQTGEGGVFPERADKYFTVDGERKDLTAEEYVRYATLKGEKSYKAVTDLVNSTAYKKLSDADKVKAIEDAYDYANQKGKEAISNYKPQSWVGKADEFANVGNYLAFKTEVASTKESKGDDYSKQDTVGIILDTAQNDNEIWKMYLAEYDAKKDIAIHDAGIGGEAYMTAIQNVDKYDKPNKSGNYGTYTNDEIATAISMTGGLGNRDKAILWQEMTGSTSTKNNPWRRYLP